METNELNKNAVGGTELMMKGLYDRMEPELLEKVQIIPSRVRELNPDKAKILWLHDLPGDPESQHLKDGGWKKFDILVFVSHWQQQMYNLYLGVPYSAGIVLQNAIEPIPWEKVMWRKGEKLKLIYTPTPHRGLALLYPVFEKLAEEYDFLELDVYSSFALYGWQERDKEFEPLFDKLRNHPNINYHGSQSNDVVRKALQKAHIFAYPSIWQETSCLCLIEAMSAGCISIHSSLGALPETSMGISTMYNFTEDNQIHASRLHNWLKAGIDFIVSNPDVALASAGNNKSLVDTKFDWENRIRQWRHLLKSLSD